MTMCWIAIASTSIIALQFCSTSAFLHTYSYSPTTSTTCTCTAGRIQNFIHVHYPTRRRSCCHTIRLHYTNNNNNQNDESNKSDESEAKRMALVRSLQEAFYAPSYSSSASTCSSASDDANANSDSVAHVQLDLDRLSLGIQNLPIWHVSWTELPGRSNVLSVHDPSYTHMFEGLLRKCNEEQADGDNNVYFGHLYKPPWSLDGGLTSWRDAVKSDSYSCTTTTRCRTPDENDVSDADERFRFDNEDEDADNDDLEISSSSNDERRVVIGTLMRVVDYRRLKDGKLLLLVQGLERFVVENVRQLRPFCVADVQILPDLEELTAANEFGNSFAQARVRAVQESFRWHDFEYDPHVKLPLRSHAEEITISDVYGPDLVAVMPHIPMASDVKPPPEMIYDAEENFSKGDDGSLAGKDNEDIESILIKNGILSHAMPHPEMKRNSSGLSCDELERVLWSRLLEYSKVSKKTIPPAIMSIKESCSEYPPYRRQKRLSYAAPAMIETLTGREFRQTLLETVNAEGRLRATIDHLEIIISDLMGEFA